MKTGKWTVEGRSMSWTVYFTSPSGRKTDHGTFVFKKSAEAFRKQQEERQKFNFGM